ncbi:unnamed protein product [Rhodiola kirilowii]
MSQRSVDGDNEEQSSVQGDNVRERRQGLPAVDQRVPPPRNQQYVNEFARHRAARHDNYDDYEAELDRQYLGGGNQHGQLARRRDLGCTMRGVCAPYIDEAPWCIRLDEDADDIEIKSGVIHHLPKFGGMADENPLRHLKEFHGVCMSMKSASVAENIFKLKTFPFSLESQAKSWLMSLPSGSITSWDQLQRKFMDKYYSHSKAAQMRKELSMLRQGRGETLFDYLARFRQLEENCPNHGIPQRMLLEYFMDGMILMERRMLDASAQGSILDMYPEEIWELIEKVAEGTRYLEETYKPAPVSNINVHSELQELKDMVAKLVTQQPQRNQQVECKVNKSTYNSVNNDNAVFQERTEDVNIVGYINKGDLPPRRTDGYQGHNKWQSRQNEGGWQRNNNYDAGQSSYPQKQPYKPPQIRQGDEDPMKEFRDEMRGMFKELTKKIDTQAGDVDELKKQMSQMASVVYERREDKGKLPSQTIPNPKSNISAIMLRNGKQVKNGMEELHEDSTSVQHADASPIKARTSEELQQNTETSAGIIQETSVGCNNSGIEFPNSNTPLPFPMQVSKTNKKSITDKEVWELFSKVEINIPLIEAIRQIPRYAQFLKELCTNRRRTTRNEQVMLGESVSAAIQRKVPKKCKDPGTFTIPCIIGNRKIENCMLDLGASINVLPYSLYLSLRIGPLKPAGLTIQLADRSCTQPLGVIEDVLVQVENLIFPADFYVLKMEDEGAQDQPPILFGRPFLKTARTKIDVDSGTLSMEVEDEVINFNIYQAMQYPPDDAGVHALDAIDELVESSDIPYRDDVLEIILRKAIESRGASIGMLCDTSDMLQELRVSPPLTPRYEANQVTLTNKSTLVPSVVQAPELQLKPLPEHLKYIYLGDGETLPVIIKKRLEPNQEERLAAVLKKHKAAIGWTLADIKGVSPTVCMHRILLEDGAKPVRQPQRRLNPLMMEVVQKEVQKLLDANVIYPISDSQWVSPVHVVPKKIGITVELNARGELVTKRIQNGWRVCIDYRKLNAVTRKDHFPLPFIDQMLDRLAGKPYFCFLDGFSGYNQIPIAAEDQEKTTFTCPFGTFAFRRMSFGLCNAPGTFQRVVMSIFSELIRDCVEVFMDDFTVYGNTFDECLLNVGRVLARLDKAKIDLMLSLPYPTDQRGVRSFVGHAGFYRRFLKDFSKRALPLSRLLQKDVPFEFTEECRAAFDDLKAALTSAPIIQAPDWTQPFEIMCDASDYAVGAVLGQRKEKKPVVIHYASRTLDAAQ